MADLDIVEVQGSKVYICDAGTAVTTPTEIGTAITEGKQIACLQDLGEVSTSREVKTYSCISSDQIKKSFGSMTVGNMTIQVLFNSTDSEGLSELRSMYKTGTRRVFIIEMTDTEGNDTPSYLTFDGGIAGDKIAFPKDGAVGMDFTVELTALPVVVDAVPTP